MRLLLGAAGAAVLAYGAWGLVASSGGAIPLPALLWLAGGVLAHDLVLAPLVLATGWVLTRLLPPQARAILQGGLVAGAVVVLVALPAVLRQGAPSDNPSSLPLDYRTNLVRVLLVVAAGTALLLAVHVVRHRRRAPGQRAGDPPRAGGATPGND